MDTNLLGTGNRRRVYLMRHGDVRYVNEDGSRVDDVTAVHLTELGHQQARTMADVLAEVRLDRIVCSGLLRTRQTAEPHLAHHPLELEIYPELREIEGGDEFGKPAPPGEIPERIYILDHAEDPSARWAGGEVIADFRKRVVDQLTALLVEPGWTSMLIVAHGVVNRAILSWVNRGGLAGMGSYEQDTGCLNIFDVDVVDGEIARRFIRQVNMTPDNLTKKGRYQTSMETGYAYWLSLQDDAGN